MSRYAVTICSHDMQCHDMQSQIKVTQKTKVSIKSRHFCPFDASRRIPSTRPVHDASRRRDQTQWPSS